MKVFIHYILYIAQNVVGRCGSCLLFSACLYIVSAKLKINLSNQKFISSNCHIQGSGRECFSLSMIWNATQLTFSFPSNTNFSFVFCQNYSYTMTCREFTSKTETSKVQLDSFIQKQAES